MTTPLRIRCRRRWSAKQYILAALLGMLAMVAVAASISVSLAPAHIAFSVQNANITQKQASDRPPTFTLYYTLTLVANNTSRRTAVSYDSLTVDIRQSDSDTAWISTGEVNTSTALPGWLPPGNTTLVKVEVEGDQINEGPPPPPSPSPPPPAPPQGPSSNVARCNSSCGAAAGSPWYNYRVVVEAKVRFRFARVPTLPYTVTASIPVCFDVHRPWTYRQRYSVNCSG